MMLYTVGNCNRCGNVGAINIEGKCYTCELVEETEKLANSLNGLIKEHKELKKKSFQQKKLLNQLAEALEHYANRMDSGGTARRALEKFRNIKDI